MFKESLSELFKQADLTTAKKMSENPEAKVCTGARYLKKSPPAIPAEFTCKEKKLGSC